MTTHTPSDHTKCQVIWKCSGASGLVVGLDYRSLYGESVQYHLFGSQGSLDPSLRHIKGKAKLYRIILLNQA